MTETKRYKVVQDARGYWGIWDTEADDFASWGYSKETGAEDHYYVFENAGRLNHGYWTREEFEWDGAYLPRFEKED